jgi:7,8-dihydroneopterin aldolase/epimerase/oxygenase
MHAEHERPEQPDEREDDERDGEQLSQGDDYAHERDEGQLGGGHGYEDDEEVGEDEGEESFETVTIEISGLSLYTHHGVSSAEREVGQRLLIDLRLDVGETDATVTDRIEDTVDYGEVCQLVALVAQQRSYRTLERLCSAIADRLISDFELEGVWVKASKPEPPLPLPVEDVSVEVWREAAE